MTGQRPRRRLLDRLRTMNEALNREGQEGGGFDPLFSADFTLDVDLPADPPDEDEDLADGTTVCWRVGFTSGHGSETAHLLSRSISFSFRGRRVADLVLENDSMQRRSLEDFEIGGPDEEDRLRELYRHLAQVLPAPAVTGQPRLPRYVIRKVRRTHCKRGPEACEKCRAMDREDFCLLDLEPPDAGLIQRRVIHTMLDGEHVWREYEVERVFRDEAEARQYALDHGISDVEWEG